MTSDRPSLLSRLPVASRQATFALFVAFTAEAAVGSSGRWLVVGPVSVRMFLFVALLIASVPLVWQQRRYLLRQSMVTITAVFLVALGLSALWGSHLGNAPNFITADLTALAALLLIPPVLALRLTRAETHLLVTVLFWASVALAAATLLVHLLIPMGAVDPTMLAEWLTERSLGGLASVDPGVQRIYVRSQILLVPALLIGLLRVAEDGRHRTAYLIGTALVAIALILSLTRAFWLGTVAALALLLVLDRRRAPALLRSLALVVVGLAVLLGVSMAAYRGPALVIAAAERLSPGLVVVLPGSESPDGQALVAAPQQPPGSTTPSPAPTQPVGTPTDSPPPEVPSLEDPDAAALQIRIRSLELSKDRIRERPLTGWGLGYNFDEIRHDGRTEYMYWDLGVKLGVAGLLLFALLYAWMPVRALIRRGGRPGAGTTAALAAALAGVAVTSYFNPFLNSTLGIALLLVLIASATADEEADSAVAEGRPA